MDIKPTRVLIVDDNADFAGILALYLSQADDIDVVGTAADGLEAVDLIIALQPDVVLLDIILPHMDGVDVMNRVQASCRQHPPQFIIISALANDKKIQNAAELGATAFLIKPFDLHELKQCIIRACAVKK